MQPTVEALGSLRTPLWVSTENLDNKELDSSTKLSVSSWVFSAWQALQITCRFSRESVPPSQIGEMRSTSSSVPVHPQLLHTEPCASHRPYLSSSVRSLLIFCGFIVVSKALSSKVARDSPNQRSGVPVSTSNSVEKNWQTKESAPRVRITVLPALVFMRRLFGSPRLLSCTYGQSPLVWKASLAEPKSPVK